MKDDFFKNIKSSQQELKNCFQKRLTFDLHLLVYAMVSEHVPRDKLESRTGNPAFCGYRFALLALPELGSELLLFWKMDTLTCVCEELMIYCKTVS